jgi:membrane protease YdiL (CAAX protease family)
MSGIESAILLVLAAACGGVWWQIVRRRAVDPAVVPFEPRSPVPWNGAHVAVAAAAYLGLRYVAFRVATHILRADQATRQAIDAAELPEQLLSIPGYAAAVFQAVSLSDVLAGVVGVLVLYFVAGGTLADQGWSTARLRSDLRLGLAAFCAVVVPALIVQAILQNLVAPSRHPIGLALKEVRDPATVFWAVAAAVFVAPVVEEFLFRGVLQGWLEKTYEVPPPPPVNLATIDPTGIVTVPVAPASPPSPLPVLFSASIFSLMHWENGVDVVPLLVIAVGLGYLFRQTHRLWPGIVMHTTLNAFSMAVLLLGVGE